MCKRSPTIKILAVDDGSTDNTKEILAPFKCAEFFVITISLTAGARQGVTMDLRWREKILELGHEDFSFWLKRLW